MFIRMWSTRTTCSRIIYRSSRSWGHGICILLKSSPPTPSDSYANWGWRTTSLKQCSWHGHHTSSISITWELRNTHSLFFLKFYWSTVDLQCCVNFCCTAKGPSYTYIYILFHSLFHYGLSQDTEYSSLCYTVGPCCSSILYIIVCIY